MICKFCSGKFHGENMTCGMFGDVVVVQSNATLGIRAMNRNRLRHIEEYDDDEIWDDRKNATDIWCFD